jgi:hypothetical protein
LLPAAKLYPQAAILGEFVARNYPKMPRAAIAAQRAVQAYNIAHRKAVEDGEEPSPMPAADVERVRNAADFLVKTWPAESAADEARHILGFFLLREAREKEKENPSADRYLEAWQAYAGIRDSYPAVYAARNEKRPHANLVRPTTPVEELPQHRRQRQKYSDGKDPRSARCGRTSTRRRPPVPDEDCLLMDAIAYLNGRSTLALLYQIDGKFDKAQPPANRSQTLDKFELKPDNPELDDKEKEE